MLMIALTLTQLFLGLAIGSYLEALGLLSGLCKVSYRAIWYCFLLLSCELMYASRFALILDYSFYYFVIW